MSGYCKGCGRISDCACSEVELTMTDNYLSENYVNKRVLRKMVEKWPESIPTDELEKLLNGGE